jgi:Cu2+-exporting ATPase
MGYAMRQPRVVTAENAGAIVENERLFAIEGITCAACVQDIEDSVAKCTGVVDARVNYSTQRLFVRWRAGETTAARIAALLRKLGYRAHPVRKVANDDEMKHAKWLLRCLAVSGFAAMNVMLLSVSVWSGNVTDITSETRDFFHWLSALIVLPAVAYAGQPFFRSALEAVSAGRVNMDVPISLGVMLSLGLSVYETATHGAHAYFDSAIMLLFFLLAGRYLEQLTRQRMRGAAHNLSSLRAATATTLNAGKMEDTEVEDLKLGDIVLVRPGERVPADGVVVEGYGLTDQSIVTGETAGARAGVGVRLFAGTLSIDGNFRLRVVSLARDSFVENLERLIDTATSSRLPYMQVAHRAARLYAPVVHTAALLTFVGWIAADAGIHDAIVTAIAVLIITCPCALALAVPTVQVVSMGEMFDRKILVNSPDLTERLAEIDTVVFDKTGTLTLPESGVVNSTEISEELRNYAARVAAGSKHPLARAVASLRNNPEPFVDIVEESGRGVRTIVDGVEVRLGSASFCSIPVSNDSGKFGSYSAIFLRVGEKIAEFRIEQRLRGDAQRVVSTIRQLGCEVVVLSGDKEGSVLRVARELHIQNVDANCRPDDKVVALNKLRERGRKVLMVGDGLNDAPALAAAHASMSPISAADLTQAQADCMFLGERLQPVLDAILISRRAKAMMISNLALTVAYNVLAIPLAVMGLVTPLVAAAAMSGSSILVCANALRVKRWASSPNGGSPNYVL